MTVAAAILAGGRGTRMGGDGSSGGAGDAGMAKGLLVVEGRRIIDRQLALLRPRFADVLIAANDPGPWAALGVRVIPDRVGGGGGGGGGGGSAGLDARIGPIAGLDAVWAALADADEVAAVVCLAGDMPFVSSAVVELLRDGAPGAMALVPRLAGRPEPLLARYARSVAPVAADQIARGAYAMVDLLARLDVTWIEEPQLRALDPGLRSIANINTPEDLARIDAGAGPDP